MNIESLVNYFNTLNLGNFYPYSLPKGIATGFVVDITSSNKNSGGVGFTTFRVVHSENHPTKTLENLRLLSEKLSTDLKGKSFNDLTVLNIFVENKEPLFVGIDNGVAVGSVNYRILEGY